MIRLLAAMLLALHAAPARPGPRADASAAFPLAAGTTWTYRGRVRWSEGSPARIRSRDLTWTLRVTHSLRRRGQAVALLDGWLGEFAWYDPDAVHQRHLLVYQPGGGVFVVSGTKVTAFWDWLRDTPGGRLGEEDLDPEAQLLPPRLDRRSAWGGDPEVQRRDGRYAWHMDAAGVHEVGEIAGWQGPRSLPFFQASYRSLPDHQIVEFTPGLGITRYVYVHHGTIAECDLRLSAIRIGRAPPSAGAAAAPAAPAPPDRPVNDRFVDPAAP